MNKPFQMRGAMNMGLKAKWTIICSVLVILLYFLFAPRTVYPSDNPDFRQIAGDGWFITGDRDSRSKYFQVDGTDDMFFVCYFNGYVDAYTIIMNYRGIISVR